jgi:hypothetical protein
MRDCYTPTTVLRFVPLSIVFRCLARLAVLGAFALSGAARAQEQEEEREQPPHYLALVSAGVPLRLTVADKFDQSRIAPAFNDVFVGYAFAGGRTRHGFGLGVSWNLTHDGGYTDPLYAGDQFAVMPAYMAYHTLNTDVIGIGHVGVPFLVRGGRAAGLEVGAALAYRLFAGAGLFAELDLDAWAAGEVALLASLELGVVIDFEVLP